MGKEEKEFRDSFCGNVLDSLSNESFKDYTTTCVLPIPKLDWKQLKEAEEKVSRCVKLKDLPNKVYVGWLEWHELNKDPILSRVDKFFPYPEDLPIEQVNQMSMISYEYWPNFPSPEGAYCTWGKQPPKPERTLRVDTLRYKPVAHSSAIMWDTP